MWTCASDSWRSSVMQDHRKDITTGVKMKSTSLGTHSSLFNARSAVTSDASAVVLSVVSATAVNVFRISDSSEPPKSLYGNVLSELPGFEESYPTFTDFLADGRVGIVNGTSIVIQETNKGNKVVPKVDTSTSVRKKLKMAWSQAKLSRTMVEAAEQVTESKSSTVFLKEASPTAFSGVSGCPYDAAAFATTSQDEFKVWTIGDGSGGTPMEGLSQKPYAGSIISAFEWSPLIQPVAALAVEPNSFIFTDFRSDKPIVGRHDNAHSLDVTAISWNPYIPYWLATGGAEGHVKIWDMRYSAQPVAVISDTIGEVTSLAWAPKHCELIAVGTTDATLSLYSVELDPHRKLLSKPIPSAAMNVGFLPLGGGVSDVFALSDTGDFVCASLDKQFFAPIRKISSKGLSDAAVEVEGKIYDRNITEAFTIAYKKAKELYDLNKQEEALEILDFCFETSAEPVTIQNFNTSLAPLPGEFLKEARMFASHIPIGFHEKFRTHVDEAIAENLDKLKLVLDVKQMIKNNQPESLMDLQPDILASLKSDKNRIDAVVLLQIIQTVLPYDYMEGLTMGLQYAEILAEQRSFASFAPVAHYLLYPTVFDSEPIGVSAAFSKALTDQQAKLSVSYNPPDKTRTTPAVATKDQISFDLLLGKSDIIVDQIAFLLKFHDAAFSLNSSEEICKVMSGYKSLSHFVLSFEVCATYLNLLSQQSRFKEYFEFLLYGEEKLAYISTPNMLKAFFSRGLRKLSAVLSSPIPAPDEPWDTHMLENILYSIIFVATHRSSDNIIIDKEFIAKLAKGLSAIDPLIDSSLRSLAKNPDPELVKAGIVAKAQAAHKAKHMQEMIDASMGHPMDLGPLKEPLRLIQDILTHFGNRL